MKLTQQGIFWDPVKPGALTYGDSFYVRPTGVEKECRRGVETKSDLLDAFEYGFSIDNGQTWSSMQQRKVFETMPDGASLRRWIMPGFADPVNGCLLTMYNEAL